MTDTAQGPILDPGGFHGPADLAAALTTLRTFRGLTVREVARSTGIPSATLGGWFSGRHLPPHSQP
ncbi:helix-turn-helix transcriptional regulator [Nocardioides kongjuensis]